MENRLGIKKIVSQDGRMFPSAKLARKRRKTPANFLADKSFKFDVAFTSILKRAIHTCWTVLKVMDQSYIPVIKSWRLNERHYGALQGLNKSETALLHGEEQVKVWRRAYRVPPPALDASDPRWPGNDAMYRNLVNSALPLTECLDDCVQRAILGGKRVLITAHGNSLRGLVKHLDNMSEKEVLELNIPTGIPLVYNFDSNFKPVNKYYLMDESQLEEKINAVAAQGKAK